MNENTAIIPAPTLAVWETIGKIAPVAAASTLYGVDKYQAAMVMLTGHELGLGLTAAFDFVHVIQGKPSLSPKGTLALIHRSGQLAGLKITDEADAAGNPTACTVWMKRKGGAEYTCRYTLDDAKRAGLVKPGGNWAKYPGNMLRWRAVGYCADVVFPDVTGGMIRPEELGAEVQEDGTPPPTAPGKIATETIEAAAEQLPPARTIIPDVLEPEELEQLMEESEPTETPGAWTPAPTAPEPSAPPATSRTWPELRDAILQDCPGHYKHQAHVVNALRKLFPDRAGGGFWDAGGVLKYEFNELYEALFNHAAEKAGQ